MLSITKHLTCLSLFLALVSSCVTTPQPEGPALSAAEIARRIPERIKDREGWARDVAAAIKATEHEPTVENVCAVLAVVEQESNYQTDPAVPNLPQIVREGLKEKLHPLGLLAGPTAAALLSRYDQQVDKLHTEGDLDRFYRGVAESIIHLPHLLGGAKIDDLNPVTTLGSMQVSLNFARSLPEYASLDDGPLRDLLYTRAGGLRAGAARLLGYPAAYDKPLYRFADYNAGVYASRNAAFQEQLASLTGQTLVLDGDILAYDKRGNRTGEETKTLRALLTFGRTHDMWDLTVQRGANAEKSADFEDSRVWNAVRDAWREAHGREAPYARMPSVMLSSPKLKRKRSTEWFAHSVEERYGRCLGMH
jgi:hypothetical protein